MEEIEVTFRLENSFDEIEKIMNNEEFVFLEKYWLKDKYMCLENIDIVNTETKEILKNSIIIRSDDIKTTITFKKKKYDEKGNTIYRERYDVVVDSVGNTFNLFKNIGYKELININDLLTVYKYKDMKVFLENIEDFGVFLELEIDPKNAKENYLELIVKNLKMLGFKFNEEFFDVKKAEEMINLKYDKN